MGHGGLTRWLGGCGAAAGEGDSVAVVDRCDRSVRIDEIEVVGRGCCCWFTTGLVGGYFAMRWHASTHGSKSRPIELGGYAEECEDMVGDSCKTGGGL